MFPKAQWTILVAVVSIEAALLYRLVGHDVALSSTELLGAICILGTLLVVIGKVEGLKSISLGKEGFKAEALEQLQKHTDALQRAVEQLILVSMGKDAYENLAKLASGAFGEYTIEHHIGLETELYHLRNIGFIQLRDGVARSIYEIPSYGNQLSDYIEVTENGRRYIALRHELEHRTSTLTQDQQLLHV
jgi:hypothetical protein